MYIYLFIFKIKDWALSSEHYLSVEAPSSTPVNVKVPLLLSWSGEGEAGVPADHVVVDGEDGLGVHPHPGYLYRPAYFTTIDGEDGQLILILQMVRMVFVSTSTHATCTVHQLILLLLYM